MSQLLKMLKGPVASETPITDSTSAEKDAAITTATDTSEVDADRKLKLFQLSHRWDPNLEKESLDDISGVTALHDSSEEARMVDKLLGNSPYPEVRASVRNYDEDVPVNTIRAWSIGMLLTTLGSGINMLFSLRAPSISITAVVALLVAYPLGIGWTKIMPTKTFCTFGRKWSLNPGRFNIKEHALIVVMANASFSGGAAYFGDTIVAQKKFYGQDFGWGFNILLALTTQCVGFGIAGLLRKLLVEPAAMIWPGVLVETTFIYTLHDHSKTDPATANGWKISRYRYFLYLFIASFIWYWFPGYIAQFLSVFAFVTWIRPNNPVVNQLFGGWTGVSLLPITFDWSQVTGYMTSPLTSPFHAIANTLIGLILFFWFTTLGLHYSNHFYAQYLPISDSNSYDNTAHIYNVTRILTPEFTLDLNKYKHYSPLFLSTTFALTYGLSFAAISSLIVHTALFHGRELWLRAQSTSGMLDDVHTKMMKKYKKAPWSWYAILLVVMVALCFVTALVWPTHLSWWALLIALLISLVWSIPIGIIQGTTNIQIGLNVFTEFIVGYMQPGRPVAMMLFKTYGYITMSQALSFAEDLKLGHYLKVPPRSLFFGQVTATVWSCLVQLGVLEYALNHIKGICEPDQPNRFTCPGGRVFFNASIIWGLIGPKRMFSGKSLYASLQWFWLVGALTPVIIYLAARRWPRSPIRFLSAPIIYGGAGVIPPGTPLNVISWGIVGYIFQKYIRNKYRGWWMRFNYVTSAGLDTGLAICSIVIILALDLTNTSFPKWWGNIAPTSTMDYNGDAIRQTLPSGETFGPTSW